MIKSYIQSMGLKLYVRGLGLKRARVSYSTTGGRYSIQLEISFSWGVQLTKWVGSDGDV